MLVYFIDDRGKRHVVPLKMIEMHQTTDATDKEPAKFKIMGFPVTEEEFNDTFDALKKGGHIIG